MHVTSHIYTSSIDPPHAALVTYIMQQKLGRSMHHTCTGTIWWKIIDTGLVVIPSCMHL